MVTPELIEKITTKFQKGQTRARIKEDLLLEGWTEDDIDDAVIQMQKTALLQIPIVASISRVMTKLDKKYSQLSPKGVVVALSICAGILLFVSVGLYFLLDPLSVQAGSRDKEREAMLSQVHTAIIRYYNEKHMYPTKLAALAPSYLSAEPLDPRSKKPLSYTLAEDGSYYDLCIYFETRPVECVSGTIGADSPTGAPQPKVTAITSKFVLNGLVFVDTNANNVRDTGEAAYKTAVVKVAKSTGETVCDEVSDATGSFICPINDDGTYTATLQIPDGFASKQVIQIATFPNKTNPAVASSTLFFPIMPMITAQTPSSPAQSGQTTQSAPMVSGTAR